MTKKREDKVVKKVVRSLKSDDIDIGFTSNFDDPAESRTIASRKRIHDKVDSDVTRFLATGGKIKRVKSHVTADPPQRPSNHYGQRPI